MDWSPSSAQHLARRLLSDNPDRVSHVAAVAGRARLAAHAVGLADEIEIAAWLHDIGYAKTAIDTGFHPLDGARLLQRMDAPVEVVSLVAYHSGAEFEASERGLLTELGDIPRPDRRALEVLTYADMTTSATGRLVSFDERLADIFRRYSAEHPVHRATLRSMELLMGSVRRVALLNRVSR